MQATSVQMVVNKRYEGRFGTEYSLACGEFSADTEEVSFSVKINKMYILNSQLHATL